MLRRKAVALLAFATFALVAQTAIAANSGGLGSLLRDVLQRIDSLRTQIVERTWDPDSIKIEVAPGTTSTVQIRFVAQYDLPKGAKIYLSQNLVPYLRVSAQAIAPLKRNQAATFSLFVAVPKLQPAGRLTGFLEVYEPSPLGLIAAKLQRLPVSIEASCPCAPPDPGPLGETTILGVDSNSDGIRDDVERYLLEKVYPTPLALSAMKQAARAFQSALTQASPQGSPNDIAMAARCVDFIAGSNEPDWRGFMALERKTTNTIARLRTYESFSARLSTSSLVYGEPKATDCQFQLPAQLP